MDKKVLLLIDGHSLLYRAYYATAYGTNPKILSTKSGIPTNAIMAFAGFVNKLIKDRKPDYMLVAFDSNAPTFRHLKADTYKAGRKETPEELIIQFDLAKELLKELGVKHFNIEGYEADDIIGTLAKRGQEYGLKVEIFSGDRDLLQLIEEDITVFLTKKGVSELKCMSKESLFEELGILPNQIIDLKGLMGDASDNIPGISGVGEKTALKLIKEYGTVEEILKATISGKLGEKISSSHKEALLSKELATIYTILPLPFSIEHTIYQGPNYVQLEKFYRKLELNQLLRDLQIPAKEQEILEYQYVEKIDSSFYRNHLAINIEITQENYHQGECICMSISDEETTFVISIDNLKKDKELIHFLEDSSILKSCYDAKRTIVNLHKYGIDIQGIDFDLLLAAYLLNSAIQDDVNSVFQYFDVTLDSFKDIYHKSNYELEKVYHYSSQKSHFIVKLRPKILKSMKDLELIHLFETIEMPLANVLAKMEMEGVHVDSSFLKKKEIEILEKVNYLEKEIYEMCNHQFNINSPSQLAEVLFDQLQLPTNKKRSTAIDILNNLVGYHPVISKIIDYRKYAKLVSTYLVGLQNYISEDEKIHTIYNQALTQTGRLSSKEPNLQNISVRDEELKSVREAFVPRQGFDYLLSIDYSQIELRILAHMANATSMIETFNQEEDIHTITAKKIFSIDGEVSSQQRRQAKAVNFGIIYGMSDWGLSNELGISPKDAKVFIEKYFLSYPEIKNYLNSLITECEKFGFVKTMFGRIRYVPEIHDSNYMTREFGKRIAMNTPIQGTAADILKIAMIEIDKMLKANNYRTKMILQVHDELIFDVPQEELLLISSQLEEAMEHAVKLKVKLKASYIYGLNWNMK